MKEDMIQKIQSRWQKFSHHQIGTINEDLDGLISMIQRAYSCSKSRAEREYHEFRVSLRPVRQANRSKSLLN